MVLCTVRLTDAQFLLLTLRTFRIMLVVYRRSTAGTALSHVHKVRSSELGQLVIPT